jgi:hypothetical protein
MDAVAVVVSLAVLVLVLGLAWAVVREVRADGYGRGRPEGERDWGTAATPSTPHARARW